MHSCKVICTATLPLAVLLSTFVLLAILSSGVPHDQIYPLAHAVAQAFSTLSVQSMQNHGDIVLDLRAECLPYMEGSELSAFLIWKVQSSLPLPSILGRR